MKKVIYKVLHSKKYPETVGDIIHYMDMTPRKKRKINRLSKIDILIDQFNSFSVDFKSFRIEVNDRFDKLENRMANVENRLTNVEVHLSDVDKRLVNVEGVLKRNNLN